MSYPPPLYEGGEQWTDEERDEFMSEHDNIWVEE